MKISKIAELIENIFPLHFAFDGDNVGLLVGDYDADITGILVTCDVDMGVVEEAIAKGCNLIVSHHPIMFSPINRMTESVPEQKFIRKMVQNGISLYSAHTNLDAGRGGINDLMASMLGMEDTKVVDVVCEDERGTHGFGRICNLKDKITLKELMDKIIDVFGADGLRYAGNPDTFIETVAVNTGGGAGILHDCIALGCDCIITGDIKYNGYRDAIDGSMCVIDIMHYDSEHIAKKWFEDFFEKNGIDVPVHKSESNINLIKTYTK